jgi:hypothetical protein
VRSSENALPVGGPDRRGVVEQLAGRVVDHERGWPGRSCPRVAWLSSEITAMIPTSAAVQNALTSRVSGVRQLPATPALGERSCRPARRPRLRGQGDRTPCACRGRMPARAPVGGGRVVSTRWRSDRAWSVALLPGAADRGTASEPTTAARPPSSPEPLGRGGGSRYRARVVPRRPRPGQSLWRNQPAGMWRPHRRQDHPQVNENKYSES